MATMTWGWLYQQFDADYSRPVPGEGFGGWRRERLPVDFRRVAVVSMHAWDVGPFEASPGIWRSVEYVPRSYAIAAETFGQLFAGVRRSPARLIHVVGGGVDYYRHLPGYQAAARLAGPAPEPPPPIAPDPSLQALRRLRSERVWRGKHNWPDPTEPRRLDFLPEARPLDDEPVVEDSWQLLAVCRELGLNHLIYCGFALDACLLTSPGGMVDLSRAGVMCSVIREATCAVENRETARTEQAKELGLWRVAVSSGFVFDLADLLAGLADAE